jgi:hypothetical protein
MMGDRDQEFIVDIPANDGNIIIITGNATTITVEQIEKFDSAEDKLLNLDKDIIVLKEESKTYVKNTDYGSADKVGLVKYSAAHGTYIDPDTGMISVVGANEDTISKKTSLGQPIMPKYLDYAVKVGITTNTETLTDEEKAAACEWLGISDMLGSYINDIDTLLGGD